MADTNNNLVQSAEIQFPAAKFPLPALPDLTQPGQNLLQGFLMQDRLFNGQRCAGWYCTYYQDLIRTMIYKGDGRLAALTPNIPATQFTTFANYSSSSSLVDTTNLDPGGPLPISTSLYKINGSTSTATQTAPISPATSAASGDFDLGTAVGNVGPFMNKADEGDYGATSHYYYYSPDSSNPLQYTPNRIMPSAGMFGSLPTGVKSGQDWTTLLFRPQPSHPNFSTTIPDHLVLDLFWMPIVEPFALSENFSTAGKVNMNYQILPFTYITRSTALLAAMKTEMVSAVPNNRSINADPCAIGLTYGAATNYRWNGFTGYRQTMNSSDTNGTLRQFREKFGSGQIFRSASEICDIYLVPGNQSWTSDFDAQAFWANHRNTPENLREKPYANLYARLTTKSNTFTVHVRAQALQKVSSTSAGEWVEGADKVIAEERVSSVTERYIDSSTPNLPDFATNPNAVLSDYYHMRILSTKRFRP